MARSHADPRPELPAEYTETPLPAALAWPGFGFTMAFQPVVDLVRREVFCYEALVRGLGGEGAASVLGRIDDGHRYAFDQLCRFKAIALGMQLGVGTGLGINFLPNALSDPNTSLLATVRAARGYGFPVERLLFEVAEGERVADVPRVVEELRECRREGLRIAIDDFGAGYAGLNLLAELHPDLIKLDIALCRGIDGSRRRRAIVHGVLTACRDLGIEVIAEGVETPGEVAALADLGVRYFQGYLFARPAQERLPEVRWPAETV